MSSSTFRVFAVGLALATAPACAVPALDYTLGVQLEHDDNINLSRDNPVSATILSPQLTFDYHEQGSALNAIAAGAFQYDDYLGNVPYASHLRSLLSGSADWTLSPQRLDWVFEDYLGRQPIDVFAPNTPDNQQQTNVFETGPTLRARLGESVRGRLDLRYTNTYADHSKEFDSNRMSALGRLGWLLDPVDTLSVSANSGRVRYTESQAEPFDYDRNDAFVGYEHTSRLFKVDVSAGYSWLDLNRRPDRAGALFDATLRWTPSAVTDLGLTLKREFSDASQDLVIAPDQIDNIGVGSSWNNAVITPQLYVEKLARLEFNHTHDRLRFTLAPFWRELDYFEGPELSQRSRGYYAQAAWLLRPALTLVASTGLEHRQYPDIGRRDNDMAHSLALVWQHSRHWLLSLRAEHLSRDSRPVSAGYSDNAIVVAVTWKR